MLTGVNYHVNKQSHSVLYIMLFEQKYGAVEMDATPYSKYSRAPYYSWIGDFPKVLLEIDVTLPHAPKIKVHDRLFKADNKKLGAGASATSMAATFVPATKKIQLYLAFSYSRPISGASGRYTGNIDRYENSIMSETYQGSGGNIWDSKVFCEWQGTRAKSPHYGCKEARANAPCYGSGKPKTSAKQKQCYDRCNSMYPNNCNKDRACKTIPSPMKKAYDLRTDTQPPLLLWEFAPLQSASLDALEWKFEAGPMVQEWNNLRNCARHSCCYAHPALLHAKKWASPHLQQLQDGRGIALSYTSLDNEKGCFKQKLRGSFGAKGNACKNCFAAKKTEAQCRAVCKSNVDKGRVTMDEHSILGCTGIELLTFDGQLHRTPLAARKTRPLADGEPWVKLPMLGDSSTNVFYPHSKRTYIMTSGRRGFLQAIDVTEPIGASVAAAPGSVLSPVAVTTKNLAKQTPGIVIGGLEGESPVIFAHKTDIFTLTTFQRLWRFDALQVIPCGNVMKYYQPLFLAWSVSPGTHATKASTVYLTAATATPGSKKVPWLCELSKKTRTVEGTMLSKHIACCNPQGFKGAGKQACCVDKTANAKKYSKAVVQALTEM